MKTNLAVICTKQSNGTYFAICPEVKGCFTQANTYEEAITNLRELTEQTLLEMQNDEKDTIINFQNRIFTELEVAI
jgi:predicted RNase H-like HicB family nuclease